MTYAKDKKAWISFLLKGKSDWERDRQIDAAARYGETTQKMFCMEELDVSPQSFSRWLDGVLPSSANMDKLARSKYYGPRVYKFAGMSMRFPGDPNDPDSQRLMELWPKMSPEQRRKWLQRMTEDLEADENDGRRNGLPATS